MKFKYIIIFSLTICGISLFAGEKPNILIVFSDQQNTLTLGCYGNEHMNTPNIDKLADEGMRFDNSISPWPMCTPYRAMLMTGKHPFNSGVTRNDLAPNEGIPMMGEIFKKEGYLVGNIGKWHLWYGGHSNIAEDYRGGFTDCWHEVFPQEFMENGRISRKKFPEDRFEEFSDQYFADVHANHAIDFFKKAKKENKPFLAVVAWNPPHPQYFSPKRFLEKRPLDTIPLPKTVGVPAPNYPGGEKSVYTVKGLEGVYDDYNLLKTKVLQPYFASCEALDYDFGRMMQSLRDLGMYDNTIIIYTSDHGEMGGAHQLTQKFVPYEESIRTPFIIKYPKVIKAKSVTDRFVSPIDVIPTLLDLANIKYEKKDYDGKSMLKTLESKEDENAPDAVLIMSTESCWRGVRTKQFTYAERVGRPWLLYDNKADPYQENNLIASADYADELKKLQARMNQLLIEANDPYVNFPKDSVKQHESIRLAYWDSYMKFREKYPEIKSPLEGIYQKWLKENAK